jgi:hypothetical protein
MWVQNNKTFIDFELTKNELQNVRLYKPVYLYCGQIWEEKVFLCCNFLPHDIKSYRTDMKFIKTKRFIHIICNDTDKDRMDHQQAKYSEMYYMTMFTLCHQEVHTSKLGRNADTCQLQNRTCCDSSVLVQCEYLSNLSVCPSVPLCIGWNGFKCEYRNSNEEESGECQYMLSQQWQCNWHHIWMKWQFNRLCWQRTWGFMFFGVWAVQQNHNCFQERYGNIFLLFSLSDHKSHPSPLHFQPTVLTKCVSTKWQHSDDHMHAHLSKKIHHLNLK